MPLAFVRGDPPVEKGSFNWYCRFGLLRWQLPLVEFDLGRSPVPFWKEESLIEGSLIEATSQVETPLWTQEEPPVGKKVLDDILEGCFLF